MKRTAMTVAEYINGVDDERRPVFKKMRAVIKKNLPKGFTETIGYGMLAYVVPLSRYPKGYHADPSLPLGMIYLAAQKSSISLHHLGIYGNTKLYAWFESEYRKHGGKKSDIGKGCVRFKDTSNIPFDLIGRLAAKFNVDEWIEQYETTIKR